MTTKKLNLLESKLFFGILTAILFTTSLVVPASPGLVISFFTTVSAVITIVNFGVPIKPVPLIAIICHLLWISTFLFISVNNNDTPSLLYIQRIGGIFGAVLLMTGLIQSEKIRKSAKTSNELWVLSMAVMMGVIGFLMSL